MQIKRRLSLASIYLGGILIILWQSVTAQVIDWSSDEGKSRLVLAEFNQDFFRLAPHFEGQENKVFCGAASMTIIANALRVNGDNAQIPQDPRLVSKEEASYFPKGVSPLFHRYSQATILASSTLTKSQLLGRPKATKFTSELGMQLTEFEALAQSLDFHTSKTHVEANQLPNTDYVAMIKQRLILALQQQKTYVIGNYSRASLKQKGAGHFSPIVAYHRDSDSFLIMDVSNTYQNWVWVDSSALLKAMATTDVERSRGFVIVDEPS
ncbi:phytochelatin synthase family protein [Shewanella schlegeliana]|uniref:glutathione gamma-glutamylcysteinyltransferase n=1 Tax=Shewanella schlegeliana TaxID=190308 RepID=A0ABS1SYC0_9GAMM|nr:phytochelatin synthase family protein [Shewanella schlegeliana]MBL4912291.1 phytochelatin synthase [Shewanella schlegeliana]MCL1108240.1 phytochelatin synthase family protein [Shewanella schlegeliana]GIU22308.1 hypothetical protein TUM4433_02990 [Shewanella schlegeliana]